VSSVTRRRWLQRTVTALGGLTMGACDRIAESPRVNSTLDWAEEVTATEDRIRAAARGGMRLVEARKQFGYHSLQTREKT